MILLAKHILFTAQVLIGNDSAADSIAELIMKLVPADSYEKSVYDYINFMYDGKMKDMEPFQTGLRCLKATHLI